MIRFVEFKRRHIFNRYSYIFLRRIRVTWANLSIAQPRQPVTLGGSLAYRSAIGSYLSRVNCKERTGGAQVICHLPLHRPSFTCLESRLHCTALHCTTPITKGKTEERLKKCKLCIAVLEDRLHSYTQSIAATSVRASTTRYFDSAAEQPACDDIARA